MAENPAQKSSLREPTADEVRTLSQRIGFVIREEEISVYQGTVQPRSQGKSGKGPGNEVGYSLCNDSFQYCANR